MARRQGCFDRMSASLTNGPVWRQGMFMRPQHFQQLGRSIDSQLEARVAGLQPAGWGIRSLVIDPGALALGKFAIQSCRAIMPDGLAVSIPQDTAIPNVLSVPSETRDRLVLLGLPMCVGDGIEIGSDDPRLRYTEATVSARDVTMANSEREDLLVRSPNLQLFLEGDEPPNTVAMPIARIADASHALTLDPAYIPPILDVLASPALLSIISEFEAVLRSRSRAIATGTDPLRSQNHAADVIEFMLLQTTNRYLPLMVHYRRCRGTHPETLYRSLLLLAGDVSAFLAPQRQPPDFPAYDHHKLSDCILPLLRMVRAALVSLEEQAAIALPLQASRFGIWVSPITDRDLLDTARFILSVGADLNPEVLRSRAPQQLKLGPIEQIRDLTQLQLPGITLMPLPTVPRELPYRSEAVYLQLDKTSAAWGQLKTSAALALHISGEYPGLRLEFWAIRDGKA
jgi:type VI secretion system protein ImpJ